MQPRQSHPQIPYVAEDYRKLLIPLVQAVLGSRSRQIFYHLNHTSNSSPYR